MLTDKMNHFNIVFPNILEIYVRLGLRSRKRDGWVVLLVPGAGREGGSLLILDQ